MARRVFVRLARNVCFWTVFIFINLPVFSAHADVVFYTLEDLVLDDGTQMTGTFSWTFDADDFENGVGEFTSLTIPHTLHNQDDLTATFDIGSSIEITFPGNVHDDGVDITLFLSQPLTPLTSSSIDTARSKYDIGGNGFFAGLFLSGTISPVDPLLSLTTASPGFVTISWEPDTPGYVLQETLGIPPTVWVASVSGSTNPIVVPAAEPRKFFRLFKP